MRVNALINKNQQTNYLIGKSSIFNKVLRDIEQVGPTDCTILISGETGTGKELLAHYAHKLSDRSNNPITIINCATLGENLIESELFGHELGAFTGAIKKKLGQFELANSGTIFLDEIGELAINLQAKLLRVLQEKTCTRVGGSEVIRLNVRIIAATNRNLREMVTNGKFREDLYYRLNVFQVESPPLRDRREDIPLLVQYFIDSFNGKYKKNTEGVSKSDLDILYEHNFPGNIRELQNIIERAVVTSIKGKLNIKQFLLPSKDKRRSQRGFKSLDEVQRDHIVRVMKYCKGRISGPKGAAKILNINAHTLISRMEKLGIDRKKTFSS